MAPVVELESVSKLYGTFVALRKISLNLEQGRCCVLLGENGAAKSTLLRMIAGLIRPTHGSVRIFGEKPHDASYRIGYMSHTPMLYELEGLPRVKQASGRLKDNFRNEL